MADRNEADSPDESASAARPEADDLDSDAGIGDIADSGVTSSGATAYDPAADRTISDDEVDEAGEPVESAEDEEALEEHVAPADAREPTLEELEQMLEGDAEDGRSPHSPNGRGSDDDPDDDLVSVGAARPSGRTAASKAGSEGAANRSAEVSSDDRPEAKTGRKKKDKATPRQRNEVEKRKRTTPVGFVKEAVGELRKVVYPTGPQLGNYFVVVLVFVLVIIGFVGVLDLGFGWLIVKVFG